MNIVKYLENDTVEFPDIVKWYDKIINNTEYLIITKEDYYFILKPSKNKICRVEKLKSHIHLSDILKEIDNYLPTIQQVYVPLGKWNVIDSFSRNGFKITEYVKDKYVKGKSVFLMERVK